jgi:pyridoxine/pyridoxamine 5'-phosphate oxidase
MPRKDSPKRKEPEATRPTVPGYEVSAKKTGLLPWKWAAERLKKSRQYWIATTRPDGAPHLMIIWGLWLEDAFWFSTGATSRKARNLAGNPKCVIGTDNAAEAVILEGTVEAVETQHAGLRSSRQRMRRNTNGMCGRWHSQCTAFGRAWDSGFLRRSLTRL